MKRRELLTGAGKVAAAALVAPLLPLGTIPLKPARLTTQYLVTFEGQVRELMVWDRGLAPAETADLAAYLEKKYETP
ncbi:MAG: hypothetical protein IIB19_00315 [Chloroflexi bacterium]|nr:hypothetical protein [Chloroflexota bacterium]